MTHDELIQALVQTLDPSRVLSRPHQLLAYDCDGYVVHKARPRAVVFPETTNEVAAIVRLLHENQIPFLPRGAGTGLSGGEIGRAHV